MENVYIFNLYIKHKKIDPHRVYKYFGAGEGT